MAELFCNEVELPTVENYKVGVLTKNGCEFYPLTHIGAVIDDLGNPMQSVINHILDSLDAEIIEINIDNLNSTPLLLSLTVCPITCKWISSLKKAIKLISTNQDLNNIILYADRLQDVLTTLGSNSYTETRWIFLVNSYEITLTSACQGFIKQMQTGDAIPCECPDIYREDIDSDGNVHYVKLNPTALNRIIIPLVTAEHSGLMRAIDFVKLQNLPEIKILEATDDDPALLEYKGVLYILTPYKKVIDITYSDLSADLSYDKTSYTYAETTKSNPTLIITLKKTTTYSDGTSKVETITPLNAVVTYASNQTYLSLDADHKAAFTANSAYVARTAKVTVTVTVNDATVSDSVDFSLSARPKPSLTVSPTSLTFNADSTSEQTVTVTVANPLAGETPSVALKTTNGLFALTSVSVKTANTVYTFKVSPSSVNDGTTAKTNSVTVSYKDATSKSVTLTQKAASTIVMYSGAWNQLTTTLTELSNPETIAIADTKTTDGYIKTLTYTGSGANAINAIYVALPTGYAVTKAVDGVIGAAYAVKTMLNQIDAHTIYYITKNELGTGILLGSYKFTIKSTN